MQININIDDKFLAPKFPVCWYGMNHSMALLAERELLFDTVSSSVVRCFVL